MEKILAKKICPNHSHEFHQSPDDPRKASRQKEPRKDAATLRSDVGMLGVEGGTSDWWGARRSIWRQGRVWQRVVSRGVVDGARESTSTAILSRLCDLELFPPPQEKAARAPIISSLVLFRAPQGRRRREGLYHLCNASSKYLARVTFTKSGSGSVNRNGCRFSWPPSFSCTTREHVFIRGWKIDRIRLANWNGGREGGKCGPGFWLIKDS